MKNVNGTEDWRVLCELASKETDLEKFINLLLRTNQALEESRQNCNVNANGYPYSVAHHFSRAVEYDC